ncbi:MAG: SET domain-containing protein [Candidatus Micrarchaeota archaeon]|nr:SET domain-containing protein [Candidatus Micrarchaeota archaeon]
MMCVKTKIRQSKIHGIGLFADQNIKKGTIVWRFTPNFDLRFTKKQIKKLPNQVQKYLEEYVWLSKKSGKYCFSSDNGKYFNHSDSPNVLSAYYKGEEEVITKAIRDIKKGEEITDDYHSFEKNFRKPKTYN